jgi:hypothetical protein
VSLLTDAIDAIATDLEAQAGTLGLPSHRLQKYAKPLLETPAVCPLLAVYAWGADPQPLATDGTYTVPERIVIGWFEAVPESMETGIIDPAKAKAALDHSEAIVGRVRTYFAAIPGWLVDADTTVTRVRYGHVRGGIYGVEITVDVTTWQ